jgi:hypothetical protein
MLARNPTPPIGISGRAMNQRADLSLRLYLNNERKLYYALDKIQAEGIDASKSRPMSQQLMNFMSMSRKLRAKVNEYRGQLLDFPDIGHAIATTHAALPKLFESSIKIRHGPTNIPVHNYLMFDILQSKKSMEETMMSMDNKLRRAYAERAGDSGYMSIDETGFVSPIFKDRTPVDLFDKQDALRQAANAWILARRQKFEGLSEQEVRELLLKEASMEVAGSGGLTASSDDGEVLTDSAESDEEPP